MTEKSEISLKDEPFMCYCWILAQCWKCPLSSIVVTFLISLTFVFRHLHLSDPGRLFLSKEENHGIRLAIICIKILKRLLEDCGNSRLLLNVWEFQPQIHTILAQIAVYIHIYQQILQKYQHLPLKDPHWYNVILNTLMWGEASFVSVQVRSLHFFPRIQPPGRPAGSAGRHGDRQRRRSVQVHR